MSARRVVLVDSRDNRRQLMRLVVSGNDDKAILVGEADSRTAAVTVVERENADVVLLDVQMPVSEGLATIVALRERYPRLGIVACSFDLDSTTVQQALEAGADACLAKPVNRTDIHRALAGLLLRDDPAEGQPFPLTPIPAAAAVPAGAGGE